MAEVTATAATLREHFPEFADAAAFPDSSIAFWLSVGTALLNASRWGTMLDTGIELFVAHHLVLEAQAVRAAASGGIPGTSIGVVNSKSVDKVSIGYDASAAIDPKDGHWNLTTYGMRFLWLMRMFGAGPVQVGLPYGAASLLSSNQAWTGPWPWNFPNPSG